MTTYVLMTAVGLVLAFCAQCGDRSVMRHEPRLAEINPGISRIFFAGKTLGMMFAAAGFASTVVAAYV